MTDLISRADVIEKLDKEWLYSDKSDDWSGLKTAIEIIESLPSADAVQGWIPCSERLPNDAKDVLVCMRNGWIYMASYRHNRRLWKFYANGYADCEIVIAWMPLPKPYREEGE